MNTTTSIPVAILVRVSTSKQETDRQVHELEDYARQEGLEVVEVCRETISGAASSDRREGIQRVLELAREKKIKKVLVHEVSRVARRNSVAHGFVEELEDLQVSLYWHAQRIETLLPSGKRNPAASVMFALLSELARSERETLGDRVRSGLMEAAKHGRFPGRPKGSVMTPEEMLKKHAGVLRLLKAGHSIRHVASIAGVSNGVVQRVKKAAAETGRL